MDPFDFSRFMVSLDESKKTRKIMRGSVRFSVGDFEMREASQIYMNQNRKYAGLDDFFH
jgi:hypothetical protein